MLIDRPLFTHTWDDEDLFVPADGSVYIFASAFEKRGEIESAWRNGRPEVTFLEIVQQGPGYISLQGFGRRFDLPMRGGRAIVEFFKSLPSGAAVYLDITSMAHATWAPLVRACSNVVGLTWRVVYSEPIQYTLSKTPTEGDIYDLSERIGGIAALPGFARLTRGPAEEVCFIPLLGFEGTRFAHIREDVQPPKDKIIPIIGIPGFRPEFPFAAYLGNRTLLLQTRSWLRAVFARANCPFSLYYALEDVGERFPKHLLKVAPIGTKPHALGAVLFALSYPDSTELVYDHPVRKAGRTSGRARVLVYAVSEFLS